MANKALKSIKFPGLSDTYTIPQVDNTLAVSGAAADAKKTGDELGNLKSAVDNLHDAESVSMPSVLENTSTNYNAWTSQGVTYISNRVIPKGSYIDSVDLRANSLGTIILVNNQNKVVFAKQTTEYNFDNVLTHKIDYFATEDVRFGFADFKIRYKALNESNDTVLATDGVYESTNASPAVGDVLTITLTTTSTFFRCLVQWHYVAYKFIENYDLVNYCIDAKSVSTPNLLENTNTNYNSWTSQGTTYISDRVIPKGSYIDSVDMRTNSLGTILLINDNNQVVFAKQTTEYNYDNVLNHKIGFVATENVRFGFADFKIRYKSLSASDETVLATGGVYESANSSPNVGDVLTVTLTTTSTFFRCLVQWRYVPYLTKDYFEEINKSVDNLTDATKYGTTTVTNSLTVGLPILYLYGDTTGMSKDNAVTLSYQYNDANGNCTVKWQGSSSLNYSKKNYTIKFDDDIDVGWGDHSKYCFKANYIDNTSALNVCCANLWAQIVYNRGGNPAISAAPNNGAIDGFPVIIMLNGDFHGLFTWNIPKDKWLYGMGSSDTEYIVTAEAESQATQFNAAAELDGTDFELEYAADGVEESTVKTALNSMLTTVSGLDTSGWENSVTDMLDIGNVIDYYIFSALLANTDGIVKNYILTSYNGEKWFFNAYDLDSTLGNHWTGGKYYSPKETQFGFANIATKNHLFYLIYTYNKSALITRYNQLRNDALSDRNLYMTLYNFCAKIPAPIVDMDNRKWPLKPGTYTETLSRIMEWYRMRLAYIDAEVQAMGN